MTSFHTRVRHSWAVLNGRIILPCDLEGMMLMADLTKTAASLAALSASANRLIATSADNANQLAAAQATIASADSDTSTSVDAITSKIDAAAPPPAAAASDAPTS